MTNLPTPPPSMRMVRVSGITDATGLGAVTSNSYDAKGNLTATTDPDGVTTTTSYNGLSEPVDTTVAGVTTEHRSYDTQGHLLSVGRPGQTPTRYTWASGRVSKITKPDGTSTSLGYDVNGFVASVSSPAGTINRVNDPAGRIIGIVSPAGARTGMDYDADGNLTALIGDDNVAQTWAYDPAGHVTAATDKNNHITETTHYAGTTVPDQTVTYTSTPAGNIASIAGQDSTTNYTWDTQGRLADVNDTVAGDFDFTYNDATGNLASMTRPNNVTDQFTFDTDGRLTTRDALDSSGTLLNQADYTYDNTTGLRDTLTDLQGIHGYSYDTDGRLTGVDNPDGGAADEAYTYDDLGNLTSWPGNPTAQVKHNTADQLIQDATNTYTYDAEGNQTHIINRSTGNTTKYTWNAAHQLTKITNPDSTTITYGYGPLGRRLTATDSTSTKTFVWAGANLRATIDSSGAVVNRNISTPELNGSLAVTTPTATSYPLKDGLGSTTATTNTTGDITSTTTYTAYGTPTTTGNDNSTNTVAGYTGHQTDPTGLNYTRARYYNPTTGTFLSEDPVANTNPYWYVSANPIKNTDPTGAIEFTGEGLLEAAMGFAENAAKGALGSVVGMPAECGPVFASRGGREGTLCILRTAARGAISGVIFGPHGELVENTKGLGFACVLGGLLGFTELATTTSIEDADDPSQEDAFWAFTEGCGGAAVARG